MGKSSGPDMQNFAVPQTVPSSVTQPNIDYGRINQILNSKVLQGQQIPMTSPPPPAPPTPAPQPQSNPKGPKGANGWPMQAMSDPWAGMFPWMSQPGGSSSGDANPTGIMKLPNQTG